MGRIQGEHHVRSHRLHGTRRRHPAHRGSARGGWSVDRHLEVLEPQYGPRCPTILAAAALRRTSGLALRTSSAPTLQSAIRLLARLPSPSGLVSATKTCPRPAELCRDEGLYRPPSWPASALLGRQPQTGAADAGSDQHARSVLHVLDGGSVEQPRRHDRQSERMEVSTEVRGNIGIGGCFAQRVVRPSPEYFI